MNRRTLLESGGLALSGGIGLAGCLGGASDGADGSDGGGAGDGGGGGERTTVGMHTEGGTHYFDPIGLYVEPGTTVRWVNESGAHSATAYAGGVGPSGVTRVPEGAEAWNSGTIVAQGKTYDHTFEAEGTYDYFCVPHKTLGMIGRLVVGDPGGPAEGSMPPDGDVPESGVIVENGAVSYDAFVSK